MTSGDRWSGGSVGADSAATESAVRGTGRAVRPTGDAGAAAANPGLSCHEPAARKRWALLPPGRRADIGAPLRPPPPRTPARRTAPWDRAPGPGRSHPVGRGRPRGRRSRSGRWSGTGCRWRRPAAAGSTPGSPAARGPPGPARHCPSCRCRPCRCRQVAPTIVSSASPSARWDRAERPMLRALLVSIDQPPGQPRSAAWPAKITRTGRDQPAAPQPAGSPAHSDSARVATRAESAFALPSTTPRLLQHERSRGGIS